MKEKPRIILTEDEYDAWQRRGRLLVNILIVILALGAIVCLWQISAILGTG